MAQHERQVKAAYVEHLRAGAQYARLAQLAEQDGRLDEALDLWLQAGKPGDGCEVALSPCSTVLLQVLVAQPAEQNGGLVMILWLHLC